MPVFRLDDRSKLDCCRAWRASIDPQPRLVIFLAAVPQGQVRLVDDPGAPMQLPQPGAAVEVVAALAVVDVRSSPSFVAPVSIPSCDGRQRSSSPLRNDHRGAPLRGSPEQLGSNGASVQGASRREPRSKADSIGGDF